MQNQLKDIDRLADMQEYSKLILEHLVGIEEEHFYENRLIQLGLVKMLENIGEAAYQISRATKAEFIDLEWDKIISARHVYVHDYFKIDWTKIWVSLHTIDFTAIIRKTGHIINSLKKRFDL